MVPLSKIVKLLKMTEAVKASDYDEKVFLTDVIDVLCYISKSENHVMRLAENKEVYKILKDAVDQIEGNRHLLLHSVISMSSSLLSDKTTNNQEIAREKWGADMEGFKLLEQLRAKVSEQVAHNSMNLLKVF